jgi:molybdate transport system substrate-binding protein
MTDLKLFSTLAVRKPLDDVLFSAFTVATGVTVVPTFDPTVQLLRRIDAGETFDVMIGVTGSFDELSAQGIVSLDSRTAIARTGVGVAVGPAAMHPDISTAKRFREALLSARSVAYSQTGASGIYFAQLIEDLGIADAVNAKATIIEKGFIADAVVDGRADLAIQQMSELLFVEDAEIVGPFPDAVQHYTEFSAALSTAGTSNAAAVRFVEALASAESAPAYIASNLEPLTAS